MFLPVVWYEWMYEFEYETNTARSLDRYTWNRFHKWVVLKPNIRKYWHIYYWLSNRKKMECIWVHNMSARYFHWPVPEWTEVCHNDWNAKNNHPDNLRYWTRLSNMQDLIAHKRTNSYKKWEKSKLSKPILQYSIDWFFIKKYAWISDAARILWFDQSCISRCLLWQSKTSYWFIWKFE